MPVRDLGPSFLESVKGETLFIAPRFFERLIFQPEPSRWEASETDGEVESSTEGERRSQDVEIELAIAFSNVNKYRCEPISAAIPKRLYEMLITAVESYAVSRDLP